MRSLFVFSVVVILTANMRNTPAAAQAVGQQISSQATTNAVSPKKSAFKFHTFSYKDADRDWNIMVSQLHTDKPPSDAQIKSFVLAMIGAQPDEESVCSAGFFQISESDSESLVASIDVNGRHYCNDVEVIHNSASGLTIQGIFAWYVNDVNDIVRDPDKNGKNVLIIPAGLSGYEGGANCIATWGQIYVLKSGTLVNRSAAFKDYYKESFDSLNAKILKAKTDDVDQHSDNTICLQMEADKIARFLGTSANAGKDRAMDWVNSGDGSLRRKGFGVLADIGDQQSIEVLQRYATDSDPNVAADAERVLQTIVKK
jgi:hypothetical protein